MKKFTFSPFNVLVSLIDVPDPDPDAAQELQLRVENIRKRIPEKIADSILEICDQNSHPSLEGLRKASIHRFVEPKKDEGAFPGSKKRQRVDVSLTSKENRGWYRPVDAISSESVSQESSNKSNSLTVSEESFDTHNADCLPVIDHQPARTENTGPRRVIYDEVPSSDSDNSEPAIPPRSEQVDNLMTQVAELKAALVNARTLSDSAKNHVCPDAGKGWTLPAWNKTFVRGNNMVRTTETRASRTFFDHKKQDTPAGVRAYHIWNNFRYETYPYAYIARSLMPETPFVEQEMRDTDFAITCAGAFYLSDFEYGRSDVAVFFRAFTELERVVRLPRVMRIEINQVRIDKLVEKDNFSFDTFFGHEITAYARNGWNTVTIYLARPYNSKIQFRVDLVGRRTHTEAFTIAENKARANQVGPDYYIEEFTRVLEINSDLPSDVISLRDPVTMGPMKLPVRFASCQHPQLFDLYTFSQLVKQYPRMTCPICGQHGSIEDIRGDALVQDHIERMLRNGTLENAESLIIKLTNQAVQEESSQSGLGIDTEVVYTEDAVIDSEDEW